MKTKKTMFRFFTLFEFEEEQTFLEKQHRNGWKCTGFTIPGFYRFEKCEPQEVCYRIDFTDERFSDASDYRQLFADNGWEFLWTVNGFSIFRKPVQEASAENYEIFSDAESRLLMLKKIQKRRLLPISIIFLCAVIPNIMKAINGEFGMDAFGIALSAIWALLLFIYVYIFVKSWKKIKELNNKYGKNEIIQ